MLRAAGIFPQVCTPRHRGKIPFKPDFPCSASGDGESELRPTYKVARLREKERDI